MIVPPAGLTKPVMASMAVVLPEPFGPIKPTTSPGLTARGEVGQRHGAAVAHGEVLDPQGLSTRRTAAGARSIGALERARSGTSRNPAPQRGEPTGGARLHQRRQPVTAPVAA